jgi:Ni/Co efflux regulator RcnB
MTMKMSDSVLLRSSRNFAFVLAAALACTASFAEKPEWAGGGEKGGKHEQNAQKNKNKERNSQRVENSPSDKRSGNASRAGNVKVGGYFSDQQRVVVTTYYGEQFKAGRCPPGLAKKNNGCMPPGQAKKYIVGQRLPSNVIYYDVPRSVVYQLGAPPSGHRYVRVASDILLLAIGTGMVVDAIQNLSEY